MQRIPIIDGHVDYGNRIRDQRRAGIVGSLANEYLPDLVRGNVKLLAMHVGDDFDDSFGYDAIGYAPTGHALEKITYLYDEVSRTPGLSVITSAADLDRCLTGDDIGIILSFEGSMPFGDRIELVSVFHDLGVRIVQPTWFHRNRSGDGTGENRTRGGLTHFGIEVVKELQRLGMLVDVSHLADPGVWDVLKVSSRPIVASHSNSRRLCDHPRNLGDDLLTAIANTGGVIGINLHPWFFRHDRRPALDDVVSHIDYMYKLLGEDSIAIGADFIYYFPNFPVVRGAVADIPALLTADPRYPEGLETAADLPNLVDALERAGYPASFVEKFANGNWLRIYRDTLDD